VGQDHLGDCDFHQLPPTFDNPDSFATGKFQLKLVLKLKFSSQFPENTLPHPLEVQTMEIFIWWGSPLQKRKTTCSFSNLISTKHSSVWWYEVNLLHIFFSLLKRWVYDNYFFCHWHRNGSICACTWKIRTTTFQIQIVKFQVQLGKLLISMFEFNLQVFHFKQLILEYFCM